MVDYGLVSNRRTVAIERVDRMWKWEGENGGIDEQNVVRRELWSKIMKTNVKCNVVSDKSLGKEWTMASRLTYLLTLLYLLNWP